MPFALTFMISLRLFLLFHKINGIVFFFNPNTGICIFLYCNSALIILAHTVLCNALNCDKCFRITKKIQHFSYTSQLEDICKLFLPQP